MQDLISCGYENCLDMPLRKPAKSSEPEIVLTGIWGFVSRKLGIPPWGQILIVLLVFLIIAIFKGFTSVNSRIDNLQVSTQINDKVGPVSTKVDALAERMSTIEGEIKILLVRNSLTAAGKYAREGKTKLAVKAAQQAADMVTSAAASKLPATPAYFVDTIEMINGIAKVSPSPEFSRKLQDARLSLAEYRSALLLGIIHVPEMRFSRAEHGFLFSGAGSSSAAGSSIKGLSFDASEVTGDFISVAPPLTGTLADNIRIQGTFIKGGFQTLDGIYWTNVTFIGTHIRYRGGQLYLNHVTFLGCIFEAPDNDRGAKLAEYAALLLPQLVID
jgi:hypothetical protein